MLIEIINKNKELFEKIQDVLQSIDILKTYLFFVYPTLLSRICLSCHFYSWKLDVNARDYNIDMLWGVICVKEKRKKNYIIYIIYVSFLSTYLSETTRNVKREISERSKSRYYYGRWISYERVSFLFALSSSSSSSSRPNSRIFAWRSGRFRALVEVSLSAKDAFSSALVNHERALLRRGYARLQSVTSLDQGIDSNEKIFASDKKTRLFFPWYNLDSLSSEEPKNPMNKFKMFTGNTNM